MNKAIVSALALAAGLLSADFAQAQSPDDAQDRMVVRLGGINLQTDAGARIAMWRIQQAARRFCGEADPRALAQAVLNAKCRGVMVDKAVTLVNSERVTALNQPTPRVKVAEYVTGQH